MVKCLNRHLIIIPTTLSTIYGQIDTVFLDRSLLKWCEAQLNRRFLPHSSGLLSPHQPLNTPPAVLSWKVIKWSLHIHMIRPFVKAILISVKPRKNSLLDQTKPVFSCNDISLPFPTSSLHGLCVTAPNFQQVSHLLIALYCHLFWPFPLSAAHLRDWSVGDNSCWGSMQHHHCLPAHLHRDRVKDACELQYDVKWHKRRDFCYLTLNRQMPGKSLLHLQVHETVNVNAVNLKWHVWKGCKTDTFGSSLRSGEKKKTTLK